MREHSAGFSNGPCGFLKSPSFIYLNVHIFSILRAAVKKHHRISLGLVHELISSHDDIELVHVETNLQKGDLMTKGLQRPKHDPAMEMVGLYPVIVL